jgi:hypothetical protein
VCAGEKAKPEDGKIIKYILFDVNIVTDCTIDVPAIKAADRLRRGFVGTNTGVPVYYR